MSALSVKNDSHALTENQKKALVNLLVDDDLSIYQTVRNKILSCGQDAKVWMHEYLLSSDPVLRRRALEIVNFLARQSSDNHFLTFCLKQGEDLDIEEGALFLAQTQYPDINIAAYKALLDCYAADLREKITDASSAEEILGEVNHYLFRTQGFVGNEKNYYDPENSYLNRVMDRRTGNPISLCQVYLFLARRLKLPMVGIGMPGHFLCRYQSSREELFVDVFNKGKLLSKADCVQYLLHTSHGFQEAYLAPVSSRRILLRVCSNLHQIYLKLGLSEEKERLQRYIVALAK